MDLKKIVMDLRVSHNLKGKYPLVIFTIPNNGGVYRKEKRYFVMTYREKEKDLYFHGLSRFLHKYDPKYDFSLKLEKFKEYHDESITRIGSAKFTLISYKDDYFPFGYYTGTKETIQGENNLSYICDEFDKLGLKYTSDSIEYKNNKKANNGKEKLK